MTFIAAAGWAGSQLFRVKNVLEVALWNYGTIRILLFCEPFLLLLVSTDCTDDHATINLSH
jgi:hypothetical protein